MPHNNSQLKPQSSLLVRTTWQGKCALDLLRQQSPQAVTLGIKIQALLMKVLKKCCEQSLLSWLVAKLLMLPNSGIATGACVLKTTLGSLLSSSSNQHQVLLWLCGHCFKAAISIWCCYGFAGCRDCQRAYLARLAVQVLELAVQAVVGSLCLRQAASLPVAVQARCLQLCIHSLLLFCILCLPFATLQHNIAYMRLIALHCWQWSPHKVKQPAAQAHAVQYR